MVQDDLDWDAVCHDHVLGLNLELKRDVRIQYIIQRNVGLIEDHKQWMFRIDIERNVSIRNQSCGSALTCNRQFNFNEGAHLRMGTTSKIVDHDIFKMLCILNLEHALLSEHELSESVNARRLRINELGMQNTQNARSPKVSHIGHAFCIRHEQNMRGPFLTFDKCNRLTKGFFLVCHTKVGRIFFNGLGGFQSCQILGNVDILSKTNDSKFAIQEKTFGFNDEQSQKLFDVVDKRSHGAGGIEEQDPVHICDVDGKSFVDNGKAHSIAKFFCNAMDFDLIQFKTCVVHCAIQRMEDCISRKPPLSFFKSNLDLP